MNKIVKNLLIVVVVGVIAALGFVVYQRIASKNAAAAVPATETAVVQRGDLTVTVETVGSLLTPTQYSLGFSTAGEIVEILVDEGQIVSIGDLLVRIDDADLRIHLAQAELNLLSHTSPDAIAEAEKALADAIEAYDDAEYVNWAQQEGNRGAASTIDSLRAELILANEILERKQEAFDTVENKPLDNYQRAVAQVALSAAIEARDAIVRKLNWYLGTPTDIDQQILDADVTVTKAQLEAAEALLAELRGEPLSPELEAYVSPEITQIRDARLAVESAALSLDKTRLTAPADGVVTTINFKMGEIVNPGAPVVVLSELAYLEAEVNLDETDVVRITLGMPVVVTLDAFPGVELSGQVIEIAPSADVQSGVVLFPVTVRLDATDPSTGSEKALPLRSGMTVNITFPIEQRSDTLLVPFRAVETESGQAYVTRVTSTASERVAVTLGLITDIQVEILSGLSEGDIVTVYANPVQDNEMMSNPMFGGGH